MPKGDPEGYLPHVKAMREKMKGKGKKDMKKAMKGKNPFAMAAKK